MTRRNSIHCRNAATYLVLHSNHSATVIFRSMLKSKREVAEWSKKTFSDPTKRNCAQLVQQMSYDRVWNTINDVYNTYQDCYMDTVTAASMRAMRQTDFRKRRSQKAIISDGKNPFIDQGSKMNMASTDAQQAFPCWMDAATQNYLNLPEVRTALHIPSSVPYWTVCSMMVNMFYTWQTFDTAPIFEEMFRSGHPLRILIYSGDLDTVCNFLGNEWFVDELTARNNFTKTAWTQWDFAESEEFAPALAGYEQRYQSADRKIALDFVTIKGAGHFAPLDRGGPSLQMIENFLQSKPYSNLTGLDLAKKPLLLQYQPPQPPLWSRKDADRVWSLPGITYNLNFKHYSGYLNPSKGNYLHYWLTESQSNPSRDPLVLWLNGGPGCSSLLGLLTELGPFWPNPDGQTLTENIYSWNRMANVLFLESPRQVGYSYQNMSENSDVTFSDEETARDNFLAIMDFLSAFPEYYNRSFYVAGESYAGVYIPTLVSLMIDMIQAGKAPGLNLAGVAIGNGKMADKYQLNSAISLLYNRGLYGTDIMDSLSGCCPKNQPLHDCDFSQWVGFDDHGDAHPINSSQCGTLVAEYGRNALWAKSDIQDPYNMFQDCYLEKAAVVASTARELKQRIDRRAAPGFLDQLTKMNFASTDSQGAFQCYSSLGAEKWLQWDDVRAALHIAPEAPPYSECNSGVSSNYTKQNGDTSPVFDHIVRSGYPLRMLVYSGDLDTVCNFIGVEWFIEALVSRFAMNQTIAWENWMYMQQIAGYYKRFQYQSTFTVDVLTVKGAGHMVPTDRPGPALQMFHNFLLGIPYSTKVPFNLAHTPLKPEYQNLLQIAASSPSITRSRMSRLLSEPNQIVPKQKKQRSAYRVGDPPTGSKVADKITALPGATFNITFNHYSGYLQASRGNYLHYWLVESQGNPSSDPLILWLNGGPGCSSLGGLLTELGPFRPNPDGTTLYENQFAWNKVGNVLFIESPRDVGFSYRSDSVPADTVYNDDKTAEDNVLALQSFFDRFPEYKGREFFVTGESYAGVYTPTLTDLLIKRIQDNTMNYVNLKGLAIGNGIISAVEQINSAPQLLYYRGILGKRELDRLKPCCLNDDVYDNYCDLSQFITFDSAGNAHAKPSNDSVLNECGKLVEDMAFMKIWESGNDVYNTYQDCYIANSKSSTKKRRQKRNAASLGGIPLTNDYPFVDQASRVNHMSTDAFGTFRCYMDEATANYLNIAEVQKALHIQAGLPEWSDCNLEMNNNYQQQHNDTTSVFQSIITSKYPLRILIYNGDTDAACNFLGDEWFIEKLAKTNRMTSTSRTEWNYTHPGGYLSRVGGWVKTFNMQNITIDLLTVKGGGHFVPTDRPAPALQMIANFVKKTPYSTTVAYDVNSKPLLPEYAPTSAPPVSRQEANKIYDLPGVTFEVSFNQYSGYLHSSTPGNYLHYWFVESQGNPASDPVVLWLNGGPGCSSLGGLLTELGPFRPNPDGRTLYENVYSWNKAANMLFLETPRGVGFSYQDTAVNNDTTWDDAKTALESAAAVEDFFTVFEQFRGNDFYITGESYAGIYIPTLTDELIKRIQAGKLRINLVGIAIGNGAFSNIQEVRSNPDFLYFHGIYGKDEWDQLLKCCTSTNGSSSSVCEYERYVQIDGFGNVVGINSTNALHTECGRLVAQLAYDRVWNTANDAYNLYQDCYRMSLTGAFIPDDRRLKSPEAIFDELRRTPRNIRAAYASVMASVNMVSTDATGGFQCFMKKAIVEYLSQAHVRDAIHIPNYVPAYQKCSDTVGDHYTQLYNDSTPVFQSILNSNYPLKMLIYNGDVDSVCSILEAQWFFEAFATSNQMNSTTRVPWYYQLSSEYFEEIGGYIKSFSKGSLKIDLLTVKGAGHYVPTDRPGPALQMFTNFIRNSSSYSIMAPFDLTRKPLLPEYQPPQQGAETVTPGTSPVKPGTSPVTPGTSPVKPGTSPVTPWTSPVTPGTSPVTPGTSPVTTTGGLSTTSTTPTTGTTSKASLASISMSLFIPFLLLLLFDEGRRSAQC
uniref:Carboxypeptidase n=1 Tax=Ascaris suum TaxID=6253 RepID=F1KPY0_ASCSU